MAQQLKEKSNEKLDKAILEKVGVPTVMGDTLTNLKAAAAGENYERETMYPEFADVAEEEGLSTIATRIRAIAKSEAHHEERYNKLIKEVEKDFFKRDIKIYWICSQCGYIHEGTKPPSVCPSCGHPSSYFYKKCEEY